MTETGAKRTLVEIDFNVAFGSILLKKSALLAVACPDSLLSEAGGFGDDGRAEGDAGDDAELSAEEGAKNIKRQRA